MSRLTTEHQALKAEADRLAESNGELVLKNRRMDADVMAAAARKELEKAGLYEEGGEGDGEGEGQGGGSGKRGGPSVWSRLGGAVVVSASLGAAVAAGLTLSLTSALTAGGKRG